MPLPKNAVEATPEAVAEEAAQIQSVGEEVPGFDTGEDKSQELVAANDAAPGQQVAQVAAKNNSIVLGDKAVGMSESARHVAFGDDDPDADIMGGIVVDSFSFSRVTQKDGMFKLGDEILGQEFNFIFQSSRMKYLYKDADEPEESKEPKLAYSYDEPGKDAKDTNGKLITEVKEDFIKEGMKPESFEMVPYLEINAMIVDGGYDGTFCLIQVPKTSIPVVGGKFTEIKSAMKRKTAADGIPRSIKDIVLNMSAPKPVGTGTRKFYPFVLKMVRNV